MSNFSVISLCNQVNFQWDDGDVCFVLDQHAKLELIVLFHRNKSPRVDKFLYLNTLSWFWTNTFALTPPCCILSREAANIQFIVLSLTRPGLKPTIYHTHSKPRLNSYTNIEDLTLWKNFLIPGSNFLALIFVACG